MTPFDAFEVGVLIVVGILCCGYLFGSPTINKR